MNLSKTLRTAKSVVTANSPVLLVGAAVAGVISTGILAAKGGYKARGIVDEAQAAQPEEPLTVQDKVKLTWLCYAAPAVTGVTTIASVVGVHTIHTKRHAALAGLYALTASKMDDYSDKAEELLGAKKTQALTDALGQSAVDKDPIENHEVIITDSGTELFYDDWSGRYFMASVPIAERAVNNINMLILESGKASLNDFFDFIGLPPIPPGVEFGWDGGKKIDIRFGAVKTTDGRSAVALFFQDQPKKIDRY